MGFINFILLLVFTYTLDAVKKKVRFPYKKLPKNWKDCGSTGDPRLLYTYTTIDDDPLYEFTYDCKACFINFLDEDIEEEFCEKTKDIKNEVDRIIAIGRKIYKLWKNLDCKACYEHSGALEEALDECGIDADLVSHWWEDGQIGHAWLEICVEYDDKEYILYADAVNDIYLKKPKDEEDEIEDDTVSYKDVDVEKFADRDADATCAVCDDLQYIYHYDGISRSWGEARELCYVTYQSSLASVVSDIQMDCATQLIGDGPSPFIGLISPARYVQDARTIIRPYYFGNIDGSACNEDNGAHSGACLPLCLWDNREPLECYIGSQCGRIVAERGLGTVNNDVSCDEKLEAVLCNKAGSMTDDLSMCYIQCEYGFGEYSCAVSEGQATCKCDNKGYPVAYCAPNE